MIEAKAKLLWCPFVMIEGTHATFNRESYADDGEKFDPENNGSHKSRACWGSKCSQWVWNAGSETEGYCGLRGKVVIP